MTDPAQTAERQKIEVRAKRAIGVFDSGSGGMVTLIRMLADSGLSDISVVFVGDTANLPYGTKTQQHVAELSDAIIDRLSPYCPVIGIACNTASASWAHFGKSGKTTASHSPRVMSVVDVAAREAYERARMLPDTKMNRRRKTIGVLGTELTAEIQSHAEQIVQQHRLTLSNAIGHELPFVPYVFGSDDIEPVLPLETIDFKKTPHIAVIREDETEPGGTTRAGVRHWEPPPDVPHDVEIVARAAQKLVAAVDVAHILDANGLVKPEWYERFQSYLTEVSRDIVLRNVTSLILGCTHFEYFEREFAGLLPTLAARQSIVSPSKTLAVELFDAFAIHTANHAIQPIGQVGLSYFSFSGDSPPPETFLGLGIRDAVLVGTL